MTIVKAHVFSKSGGIPGGQRYIRDICLDYRNYDEDRDSVYNALQALRVATATSVSRTDWETVPFDYILVVPYPYWGKPVIVFGA